MFIIARGFEVISILICSRRECYVHQKLMFCRTLCSPDQISNCALTRPVHTHDHSTIMNHPIPCLHPTPFERRFAVMIVSLPRLILTHRSSPAGWILFNWTDCIFFYSTVSSDLGYSLTWSLFRSLLSLFLA